MLFASVIVSAAIVAAFALLPDRLAHRGLTKTDLAAAVLPALAAWAWAFCIYSKPGLTVGFDAFRLLAICASVLWACGCVAGLRLRGRLPQKLRRPALAVLLAAAALGAELFVCNLNYFATHSYTPVDLRPYLVEEAGDTLALNEEQNTLTFANLDQPIYNLRLVGLHYEYDGPHPDTQDPLFVLTVGATDAATSAVRQSWPWQVAANSPQSQVCSLDLAGNAATLTLTGSPYAGEYRQYPLSYTLATVEANTRRPLNCSWLRALLLFAALSAVAALHPGSVLWRLPYLQNRKTARVPVLLCAGALCLCAAVSPFTDRFSVGVATSFYNTASWDGESAITFTKHLNPEHGETDTAGQYGALATALLRGRTDLLFDPPAELVALANPYDTAARATNAPNALWDVTYYQGRYYVYFGVIPCLLFQLPFEALTGVPDLPPSLPMLLMAWLGIVAAFGAVAGAVRRWFPGASVAAYLVASTAVAGCSQVFYLLQHPSVYQYAILSGASFVMLALWQWLAAANTAPEHHGKIVAHLLFGSLCMAFVAGCRPQMEYFALFALPIFAPRYLAQKRLNTKQGRGEALAFLLPVVAVAAVLMWYNAVRFGSPFDFGANYNLTSNDMTARGFAAGRTGAALFTTFLAPATVSPVFPYLSGAKMATNYMGLTITELYYGGVLASLPVLWALAMLPFASSRLAAHKDLRGVLRVALLGTVLLAVVDCQMAGVLYRYQSDFLPPLLFAAALAWLLAEQALQNSPGSLAKALQKILRTALLGSTAAGLLYNFCVFFAAEPWLLGQSPALYQNVSHFVQFWL